MILKDRVAQKVKSATAKAGQKQEQDVAFYLRRAFKEHPQVFVINDYKFSFNNETAQIDHLIVYPYGFILVESKSITGSVKINSFGEWSRSYKGQWTGMPSPVKQVELQQKLLREMLHANRDKILGKLFGIKQQSFRLRCWDNICAISSNSIIERESAESSISEKLVKSEFLVDKLLSVMKLKNAVMTKLNVFDTRPDFSNEELQSITKFLLSYDNQEIEKTRKVVLNEPGESSGKVGAELRCKSCGESSDFAAQSGRFGYFIKCNKCSTNTAMKQPCRSCNSANTKVSKKKLSYTLNCLDCHNSQLLIEA